MEQTVKIENFIDHKNETIDKMNEEFIREKELQSDFNNINNEEQQVCIAKVEINERDPIKVELVDVSEEQDDNSNIIAYNNEKFEIESQNVYTNGEFMINMSDDEIPIYNGSRHKMQHDNQMDKSSEMYKDIKQRRNNSLILQKNQFTERASHPSYAQVEGLLHFMEKNPSIIKGLTKDPSAHKLWERLSFQLNNIGGCYKSWKQWTKYWADKKCAVKKKAAQNRRNQITGEGEVIQLSPIEQKILMLTSGKSFATGRSLAANSIGSTSKGYEEIPFSSSQPDTSLAIVPLNQPAVTEHVPEPSHSRVKPNVRTMLQRTLPTPQSPPHASEPASPILPRTPSGSGLHPPLRHVQGLTHPSTKVLVDTSKRRRKRRGYNFPSHRSMRSLAERFLRLEEQKLDLQQQTTLLMEELVNREIERDQSTTQAQLAIGEGLKLLAEVLSKNK